MLPPAMTDPAPTSAAAHTVPSEAPPEWKPEPRQWSWKDLFTAPMLAFKPKCMAVSAVTIVILSLWWALFSMPLGSGRSLQENLSSSFDTPAMLYVVGWCWLAVGAVIFSLGATFVATILKADLLDDEFLSFKEAFALWKTRLQPAILVPLFLLALPTALWGALYLGSLVGSIPYVGPYLYALLWIVGVVGALFAILVTIAAVLAISLYPGIIAVRRHGWFDNVVDTVEAVGTKPHLLVGSLLLTWVLALVSWAIAAGAVSALGGIAQSDALPGAASVNHLKQAETVGQSWSVEWLRHPQALVSRIIAPGERAEASTMRHLMELDDARNCPAWLRWTAGLALAVQKTVVMALIMGFIMNLFLAGGLLTYLWVREDDYWDEEDLQDLDTLAKELEEEARQAEASAPATAPVTPSPA